MPKLFSIVKDRHSGKFPAFLKTYYQNICNNLNLSQFRNSNNDTISVYLIIYIMLWSLPHIAGLELVGN